MDMDDSNDSDCELVIDETILVSDEEKPDASSEVENIAEDNWHLFHPVSISSSDMKDELFNDETNTCSICNETFRYNIGLICHLEMEHVELKLNGSKKGGKMKSTKKRKYAAARTATAALQLSKTTVARSYAKPEAAANVTKRATCDVCRKSFSDSIKLLRHAETCSNKYSCVYCKSKFSWESKYKKHLYKTHKFNAVVICKRCSNVFADMGALAMHSMSCGSKSSLMNSDPSEQLPQQS